MDSIFPLTDNNGCHWDWNGTKVFCLEGRDEFIELGIDPNSNGYYASTEDEAIAELIKGLYIEKDPR